jgi:hypothetical protein
MTPNPSYGLLMSGTRRHPNRNMKRRIRELLHATPFLPFVIRMADGREYRIEHPDFVLAAANDVPRITIEELDGSQHNLSALLITSVEVAAPAS